MLGCYLSAFLVSAYLSNNHVHGPDFDICEEAGFVLDEIGDFVSETKFWSGHNTEECNSKTAKNSSNDRKDAQEAAA